MNAKKQETRWRVYGDNEELLRIAIAAYDRTEGRGFKDGRPPREWAEARQEVEEEDLAFAEAA